MELDKPKSSSLEQEIMDMERELIKKREMLNKQADESGIADSPPHDKEVLREIYIERFGGSGNSHSAQNIKPPVAQNTPVHSAHTTQPLPANLHQMLQDLVNIAFSQGINEAISQAKASNNLALIDALHDVLVDQLYDDLVERGILKRF